MKLTLPLLVAVVVAPLTLACSSSSAPAPEASTFPAEAATDLQRTLDESVKANVATGVSVAVAHPKYGMWLGAAGSANRETNEALTPQHRFRAGSMLKTLVATATMQLVDEGKLGLDDTLPRVLPADVAAKITGSDRITVRMLLNHTSGIPDFATGDFDALVAARPAHVWTLDEELARVVAQRPSFAPGQGWAYTNTGYVLLGVIVAKSSGQDWRTVVAKRVLEPSAMAATTLPPEGTTACPDCSRGYQDIDGTLRDFTEVDPSMAGAAGGGALVTTPGDMTKFIVALATGKLFTRSETLPKMLDFVEAPAPEEGQTGYGLGIVRFEVDGVELFGHLGGTAGYQSFVLVQPGSGMAASGYMNRHGDFGAFIVPVLASLARIQ